MSWMERKTLTYEVEQLPFDNEGNIAIEDPSVVTLVVPGYVYPVDIGSICYTKKKKKTKDTSSASSSIYLVSASSFRVGREYLVRRYLEYLNEYIFLGRSKHSLRSLCFEFVSFVNWCDLYMQDGLDSESLLRESYRRYSDFLIESVQLNNIKHQTAYVQQRTVRVILTWIFREKNKSFLEGIRHIRKSNNNISPIEPPREFEAKMALQLYQKLFNRLTDFVISFEKYPIKLELTNDYYWLFPNESPFILETDNNDSYVKKTGRFIAYNYAENRVATFDEILMQLREIKPKAPRRNAWKTLKTTHEKLQAANEDMYHHRRTLVATLAQQSFIMLFLANTGMNLSQVRELLWGDDNYEYKNEKVGFKTIKYRAGNKPVEFFITSDFLKIFKKYIKLRRYLIDAHDCENFEYLFFKLSDGKLKELNMNFSNNFNVRLKRLFNFEININSREWRAYKSDWLIRNTDIATTAMVLQNNTETVVKHYMAGSDVTTGLELTNFFDALKRKSIIESTAESEPIAIGQCTSIDNPSAAFIGEPILMPNCVKQEGCLFCQNYAVHSDEEDIRKLLSYKYVLDQCRILSSSEEHFEKLYSPILQRIDVVLNEIHSQREEIGLVLDRVKQEVYEHESLSPYWSKKLNMLIDLEVI